MTTPKEIPVPRTLADIYQDALRLSPEEREKLAAMLKLNSDERELLVAMLDQDQDQDENSGWASPEIKQAWMDEIERRERLHAEGKNPNLSLDEARERVLAHLDRLQQ
jgi:hypothetical protein